MQDKKKIDSKISADVLYEEVSNYQRTKEKFKIAMLGAGLLVGAVIGGESGAIWLLLSSSILSSASPVLKYALVGIAMGAVGGYGLNLIVKMVTPFVKKRNWYQQRMESKEMRREVRQRLYEITKNKEAYFKEKEALVKVLNEKEFRSETAKKIHDLRGKGDKYRLLLRMYYKDYER